MTEPVAAIESQISMIFFLFILSATAPPKRLTTRYGTVLHIASKDADITCPLLEYIQITVANPVMEVPNSDTIWLIKKNHKMIHLIFFFS